MVPIQSYTVYREETGVKVDFGCEILRDGMMWKMRLKVWGGGENEKKPTGVHQLDVNITFSPTRFLDCTRAPSGG